MIENDTDPHPLKDELYALVRQDDTIFEFLQAGSLDGIWYWDIENPEQEWLSPRFKELFGYDVDEMEHSPAWWQEHIHPDDLQLVLENFHAHVANPDHPYDQVVRYRHRDGSTVWVRCRGIAIRDEQGRAIRLLGAHTDVTELEEAKAALEVANTELKAFASAIAHDLKSPLATLAGFSSILAERLADHEDPVIVDSAHRVVNGARRVAGLVDDLLQYTLLLQDLPPENVAMDEVADWVLALFEESAKERGVRIERGGDLPHLELPLAAARRVVHNLIDNAIKYAGEGATVRVVPAPAPVGSAAIAVEDDGPGIPEDERQRIFRSGVRLQRTGATPGLGIGLRGARDVAERHGGTLTVEESAAGGARFVLSALLPDMVRIRAAHAASE